ncbi:MAG: outer membrane beta-barrel protein [Tannerella sp.]|jgi:hypothetical protein|nr:outer membrane beta-barrel protein [Tannerella sp.]
MLDNDRMKTLMKRFLIILWALLQSAFFAFSQEVQLNIVDKPLNAVLNMLGLEISFDDQALSAYYISVSKTFKTPEDALFYLLSNKPFKIEKKNHVYIIIPEGDAMSKSNVEDEKQFIFTGIVSNDETKEPLCYTTVALNEIEVTAGNVHHKTDRIGYRITSGMAAGTANVEELLGKIPGISFDRVSNCIKVGHHKEVLLLVDGIQQSADYIKNLSPHRVSFVEVIHESSGRFVSEGYAAIINVILKKDFRGYDIYASGFSAFNMSGTNGKDGLLMEKPVMKLSYTGDKFNFYSTYSYDGQRRNLPVFKEMKYNGIRYESDEVSRDHPNNLYNLDNNMFTSGLNYQLATGHTIGLLIEYMMGRTCEVQSYTMRPENINNKWQHAFKGVTENVMTDHSFVGMLFYQGQINDRFRLYSDFSYNYYLNDILNGYRQNDWQKHEVGFNEYKHHTLFNIEGQYMFSPKVSVNLGYSNTLRKYASTSSYGRGLLDYREYRNKAFAYLLYNPYPKVHTKFGMAVEHVKSYDRSIKQSHVRVLPYVQANIKVNEAININTSYSVNQYYPLLYQLSPINLVIDTLLMQMGNPRLNPAVSHTLSARISFRDRLSLTSMFSFIHDKISEEYVEISNRWFRTFNPVDAREYSIQAAYEQPVGEYLYFRSMITYYLGEVLKSETRGRPSGWLIDSELNYYHPDESLGIGLGYHRNMKKQALSQGYQTVDLDNWLITANKEFLNRQLSVSCSYIPPISLGVRPNQSKELDVPSYEEKTNLHLKSYENLLLLKASFRFDGGGIKPLERRSSIRKNERENRTIEF